MTVNEMKPSPSPKVREWHRRLGKIVGTLSLQIERRHLSKSELFDWAIELETLAQEMRETANRRARKDG